MIENVIVYFKLGEPVPLLGELGIFFPEYACVSKLKKAIYHYQKHCVRPGLHPSKLR